MEGTQELSKGFSAPGLVPGMLAPTDHLAFTHDAGLDVHFMQVGLDPSAAVAPIGLMPLAPFEPPSTAESDQSCVDVPASVVSPEKPAEQPRRPHAPFFERAIEQLVAEKAAAVGCEDYDRANTSPYASPGRAQSLKGLPPTFVQTGGLDPLRDEGLEFAMRLMAEGVDVEIYNAPGSYHGADPLDPRCALQAARVYNEALHAALHPEESATG